MGGLRAGWKLLRTLAHVLAGLLTIWLRFPGLAPAQRQQCVQRWAAGLMAVLDIQVVLRGQPPASGPVLLVANHISWLDIPLLHAACYCRFVSKADVRHWPVVGAMATGAGTLYIERESRRDAMRVVHHMADSLHAGDVLAVFPEGTTSDGAGVMPFHANLLQAAIAADAPALPVALRYLDAATRPAPLPMWGTTPWWPRSGACCGRPASGRRSASARRSWPAAASGAPGPRRCSQRSPGCAGIRPERRRAPPPTSLKARRNRL